MDLVSRLREEMDRKGIKQKDLIETLDVNQGTFAKWVSKREENRRDIPNTILAKIAAMLDVDIEYLLCLQDERRGVVDKGSIVRAEIMSVKASAGEGNNIVTLDEFSTGETMVLDNRLFKTAPPKDVKIMQVDGYSMTPMLFPDSWVVYRETRGFETDGLYIINFNDELMVKMLQIDPGENKMEVISINKDYKSYKIDPNDQTVFVIVGKVIRSII